MTIAAAGCATVMSVSSYADPTVNPTQYRTYDWGPADALPAGDPRLDKDPFFQDHVQGAIEKQMALKGFERVVERPDLLIHYHANITRRIDVSRLARPYGYCTGASCDVSTTEYEAGTLVIDIVEARTNKVIWRGWAQDSVEEALENRDQMEEQIQEAVTRTLARFAEPR
jgi:hypothetical protein